MTESGGGAVDVAAFALRIALWKLSQMQTKNVSDTIVMDEPGRFISVDLQPKFGELIKLLSEKLSIQFIIVTHSVILSEKADKVFKVGKKNNISYIED